MLLSAPLLLLGAVDAIADPGFVLTTSRAAAGDPVHFSISDTESGATYGLEIGGEEVSEGSDSAGRGISGVFTMPNLGDTGRTVMVEAQITESGETTILTRTLEYLVPTQAAPGPAGTVTGPAPPTAPSIAQTPAVQPGSTAQPPPPLKPAPRSRTRNRQGSERSARGPRAQRSPTVSPELRPSVRQPSSGVSDRSDLRGSGVSSSPIETSAPLPRPRTTGDGNLTSTGALRNRAPRGRLGWGPGLTALLTAPLIAPATLGVASNDNGEVTIAAPVVLALLCLAGLALASSQRRKSPSARFRNLEAEDGDDEILRGFVHIPSSGSASGG
jgi:hypothetical protein